MKTLLLWLAITSVAVGRAGAQSSPPTKNPPSASGQAPPSSNSQSAPDEPQSTLENTIDAEESEARPTRSLVRWNEYQGPYFTMRFGAGLLLELASFAQDENSKLQIEMHPDQRLRDFRFILGGKLAPKI